jgi:mRNA-degrading endonuclease RelE of RelBE toxin-antitoxin system
LSGTDPEPYGVRYDTRAAEELDRLKRKDRPLWREALEVVGEAQDDPRGYGYPLLREWKGCYAKHFGNDRWRMIWNVDDEAECIGVLRVGRRGAQSRSIYADPPRH